MIRPVKYKLGFRDINHKARFFNRKYQSREWKQVLLHVINVTN